MRLSAFAILSVVSLKRSTVAGNVIPAFLVDRQDLAPLVASGAPTIKEGDNHATTDDGTCGNGIKQVPADKILVEST
jgi:hypothetical protein